jgi:Coenzyme PQQ synthesis protein D (PqqD)
MISFPTRVSAPQHVLTRAIGNESVILNVKTGCYFGLDEVSSRIWAILIGSETVQAAYESLLSEYEVDSERLRNDIIAFIEELRGQGLLEING